MATIKSYTTIEQVCKLVKILPIESADMRYKAYYDSKNNLKYEPVFTSTIIPLRAYIPCWSLAALLGVIPEPDLVQNSEKTWLIRSWINSYPWSVEGYSNPVDACYQMILKLNELSLL